VLEGLIDFKNKSACIRYKCFDKNVEIIYIIHVGIAGGYTK